MKILAINSWTKPDLSNHSPIDFWRIHGPLEELKKHVDWQIDYSPSFIPGADEYTSIEEFDEAAVEKEAERLGEYDIIISSYQPSPFIYALLHSVGKRYGTKYILDCDDDVFNIEPDSFYWKSATQQDARSMQRQIELSEYLSTTTKTLHRQFRYYAKQAKVFQIPNYISDAYQNDEPRDGERINIGYFGGANHYYDLHESNVLPALEKLMHKHKQVHLTTVGIPVDGYLPKARVHEMETGNMHVWLEMFKKMNFDIVIAPLRGTLFNEAKSNIKYLEATRMGAAFVGSSISPYRDLKPFTASLPDNTAEDWFDKLDRLTDADKRQKQLLNAQYDVLTNWRMEENWIAYKSMFESVAAST